MMYVKCARNRFMFDLGSCSHESLISLYLLPAQLFHFEKLELLSSVMFIKIRMASMAMLDAGEPLLA